MKTKAAVTYLVWTIEVQNSVIKKIEIQNKGEEKNQEHIIKRSNMNTA